MAVRILATSLALCAIVRGKSLNTRDTCYFMGGLVGSGDADCAGSDGKAHSDILACPLQPGAVGIICPTTLSNGDQSTCNAISGTGSYCYSDNSNLNGGKEDIIYRCYCVNGNFCCDINAEVAGGESPVHYFNDVGCNCDG